MFYYVIDYWATCSSPEAHLFTVWLWTQIAVFYMFLSIFLMHMVHKLCDLFEKWVALGVINTFDPFIFAFIVLVFSFGYLVPTLL